MKIREIRKVKGFSQIEVAQKANIAVNSLRLYEANKRQPRPDTLQAIASALGVAVRDLMDTTAYDAGFYAGAEAEEWQNHVIDELWKEEGYTFSDSEVCLINAFSELNPSGQQEAVKRVEELTEIKKYQKEQSPSEAPQDPPEGTDTTPAENPPEGAEKSPDGKK